MKYIFSLDVPHQRVCVIDCFPYGCGQTGTEALRLRALYKYEHIFHGDYLSQYKKSTTKYHMGEVDF